MLIKRMVDMFLAALASLVLAIPIFVVALMVRLTSEGPILYWSNRIGRHNRTFMMPKFRSMLTGTPAVATHLLVNPNLNGPVTKEELSGGIPPPDVVGAGLRPAPTGVAQ